VTIKIYRHRGKRNRNSSRPNRREVSWITKHTEEPIITVGTIPCRVNPGLPTLSGPIVDALGGQ
jgi:PhoPQ-activated pathogenicity-related protein